MGTYNILRTEIECPRCGKVGNQQIDLYFGYTNEMLEFKLGDKYVWRSGKEIQNGGRPKDGNLNGEGYVECELCKKDFFVKVIIKKDFIQSVEFDLTKKPLIED